MKNRTTTGLCALVLTTTLCGWILGQVPVPGPKLTPPGGPTNNVFKTLDQVEPRTILRQGSPGVNYDTATALFEITAPGSYYLTNNIQGVVNKHGILISADNVTIDLNGFELVGVVTSLSGIEGTSNGVCVTNGTVRDWGERGVHGFSNSGTGWLLSHLRVTNCKRSGINIVIGVITDCSASENASSNSQLAGIFLHSGSVLNCTVSDNHGFGFNFFTNVSATNCSSFGNDKAGFYAQKSVLRNCSSAENGEDGFYVYGSLVEFRTASGNDKSGFIADNAGLSNCVSTLNDEHGFEIRFYSRIESCLATYNDKAGIYSESGGIPKSNQIIGNYLVSNLIGLDIDSSGNSITGNFASVNQSTIPGAPDRDYEIAAGNFVGKIIKMAPSGGAISTATSASLSNSGLGPSNAAVSSPWANFYD